MKEEAINQVKNQMFQTKSYNFMKPAIKIVSSTVKQEMKKDLSS